MKLMLNWIRRKLPREFRILYGQFLLRVVDLEALSVEADVPRFLGQFAGVLILINVFRTIGFLVFEVGRPGVDRAELMSVAWHREQWLLSTMMLVTGLIAVVSWDAIFPDRRDVMILGPLPVRPRTILVAKVAACGAIAGIALLSFASGMGVVLPAVIGRRLFPAYWLAMAAACVLVYGAVFAVQGLLSLAPAWLVAALLGLGFRPLSHVAEHLVVLALVGWIQVEICMIGVSKIPFACSYLPGKTNLQYLFWAFVVIFFAVAISLANEEVRVLGDPRKFGAMVGILAGVAAGLWTMNRARARQAVLYYEEREPEVITGLGIGSWVARDSASEG